MIDAVRLPLPSLPNQPSGVAPPDGAGSFKSMLIDSIQQVNQFQTEANQAVEKFATGGEINPAEVLTAVQKADLAFKMMMQVRNKLVQAYEDIQAIRV